MQTVIEQLMTEKLAQAVIEIAPTPPGVKGRTKLGEGCVWDAENARLLWIDIVKGKIFSYDPVTKESRFVDTRQPIGTVVPYKADAVGAALCSGLCTINLTSGRVESFHGNPEAELPENLWNDGKCDPYGRLWVGSKEIFCEQPTGALWSYSDGHWTKHLSGVGVSNGLVWSKDGGTFWYIDTPTCCMDAFDFDGVRGAISNRRTAVRFDVATDGYPDGCAIDADDKIWVAMWNGYQVLRVDPLAGSVLARVPIPGAAQVTSCAFGGAALAQLYVSTASCGVPDGELQPGGKQCNAGALFCVDMAATPVRGVAAPSLKMVTQSGGRRDDSQGHAALSTSRRRALAMGAVATSALFLMLAGAARRREC